jgi:hypothetical protein
MVDGLEVQDRAEGRGIDMTLYWSIGEDGTCFACAATCAIQQLAGKPLDPKAAYSEFSEIVGENADIPASWGHDRSDLRSFERAVDTARMGQVRSLFSYMRAGRYEGDDPGFYLRTHDWERQLPIVREFIADLEAKGL